jgi:squalene synthase HpnC
VSVDHYENFPVASVLCPPAIRPAVVAIYHFARTADDLADEGDAPAEQRLQALAVFRQALCAVASNPADSLDADAWPQVFGPLQQQMAQRRLPPQLLHDLLDAFEQDVRNPVYADRSALLDYCRRSANPIGRLLLHLYGLDSPALLRQADAVCSALQLINFWQDLSVDSPRGRHYVPLADAQAHGVTLEQLRQGQDSAAVRRLVRELCDWAQALMLEGAPLALAVPGRAGWELRLVVQGGLRVLDKIRSLEHGTLLQRPRLTAADVPLLAWRALRMRRSTATATRAGARRA